MGGDRTLSNRRAVLPRVGDAYVGRSSFAIEHLDAYLERWHPECDGNPPKA